MLLVAQREGGREAEAYRNIIVDGTELKKKQGEFVVFIYLFI